MHLRWNARFLQSDIVRKRVIDAVNVVIFSLQQECWRRPACNGNIGVQPKELIGFRRIIEREPLCAEVGIPFSRSDCEMPRVDRDSKIRTAAFLNRMPSRDSVVASSSGFDGKMWTSSNLLFTSADRLLQWSKVRPRQKRRKRTSPWTPKRPRHFSLGDRLVHILAPTIGCSHHQR